MSLAAFVIGLIVGLIRKGRIASIFKKHFRWIAMLIASFFLDGLLAFSFLRDFFGQENWYSAMRVILVVIQYGLMITFLFKNRRKPGMTSLMAGTAMNGLVIAVNGGMMPIWSLLYSLKPESIENISKAPHYFLANGTEPLLFLSDVFPIWLFGIFMISIGDIPILIGIFRLAAYLPKRILRPKPKEVEQPENFEYTEGR